MTRLNGKTAVITGGATGIGRAAAKRFIEEGALVFLFGRRQDALDAAVAELGPNARAVKGSVSDEADLNRHGGRRVVFLASDDDGAADEIGALAGNLGFAPIKLGGLSEGGLLVQARGNSWGRLIFKDLVKFD